ncbi:hypothetical protein QR680_005473 [Steinernema hermaphroditum]|uniref:Uncharacterized protein n=1 Tax=Steinernema hermaphroditum TaxID=289476 RepID=A0AA39HTF6_9BILA|nr:hypothetical protein QR680_005473 [Steinernema hermaphroditum]
MSFASLVLLLALPSSRSQFFSPMQYHPINHAGMGLSAAGPQPYQIEEIYEIPMNSFPSVPSFSPSIGMGHPLFQQQPFGGSYMNSMGIGLNNMGMGLNNMGRGTIGHDFQTANVMNLINDKENFQPQGCAWDGVRDRCQDLLNTCKGGCRDFGTSITHDCRCIPLGYAALLGFGRK